MLYIIKKDKVDVTAIETHNGFRCLIEDISEAGALIRIGGKGVQNVKIKLQFNIQNKLILMVGVVRTVEYNEAEEYKYKIKCKDCGQIYYRKRLNKNFTKKYRCGKCKGKLELI